MLSYPPHLVRQYVTQLGIAPGALILDPFCGTGTTLVEAKKLGLRSIGCDTHPFAVLASRVKTRWDLDPAQLHRLAARILAEAMARMDEQHLEALSFDALWVHDGDDEYMGAGLGEAGAKLVPTGFLSRRPLARLLLLRQAIDRATVRAGAELREFFLLALGHVIANGAGNFAFGPEIYRTRAKQDYDVAGHFARHTQRMMADLAAARQHEGMVPETAVFQTDARTLEGVPGGLAGVITSPPYPNEKDYTRTTRVESVLLGLIGDRLALRQVKETMLRSNTRNVFVDDRDGEEVAGFTSIQAVCQAIEARRVELGKTSGFERLYHKVVAHYFGGMRRHFRSLHPKLLPGARLAYVVGDQLSFLMVPVPTAKLLGEVAAAEGFRVTGCDLWRERIGTKVRNSRTNERTVRVREEVLLLERV